MARGGGATGGRKAVGASSIGVPQEEQTPVVSSTEAEHAGQRSIAGL